MDINELKQLLKDGKTNVLVIENGEPAFVVVSYDQFKQLSNGAVSEIKINQANGIARPEESKSVLGEEELEILERINKDIQALKDELEKEEKILVD